MQLRAVDEWVHQVPALPPGLHAGRLPLGAVGEHCRVVLARGDALGTWGEMERAGGEGIQVGVAGNTQDRRGANRK